MTKKTDWALKINELEDFFKNRELPKTVRLDVCTNIIMPKLFVQSALCLLRANNGNKTYIPYLDRLNKLKEKLTKTQNNE